MASAQAVGRGIGDVLVPDASYAPETAGLPDPAGVPEPGPGPRPLLAAVGDAAASGASTTVATLVRSADGRVLPADVRCEPMTGAAGEVTVSVTVSVTGAVTAPEAPCGAAPVPGAAPAATLVPAQAVPREQDGSPERDGPPERPALPGPSARTILRIGASLDLRQTTRRLADAFVPGFCDAAGVYVLERLLVDDDSPAAEGESRVVVRRMALRSTGSRAHEWSAAFPADEVVAYSSDSPFARCMADGAPVGFTHLDAQTLRRVTDRAALRPGVAEVLGFGCFLAVPLVARGEVLGFTALARRAPAESFGPSEAAFAQDLTEHAAVCVDNGRLYDRERRTAAVLQRSLLPVTLPAPSGMRITHRYLPAGHASRIGGDWYDAIPLPDGKVALVVGDAMGHGTPAALVMGQLRTAVRILARLGLPPADLLDRLDKIAQELTTAQFATCVYAVCDPAERRLTVARAGHIPPIIAAADGTSEVIDLPPGLPLGVGDANFEAVTVGFPERGMVIMCTDGLIEKRGRDVETGLAVLRSVIAGAPAGLEAVGDAIVEALHTSAGDDATLLLARLEPRSGGTPVDRPPRAPT